MIYAVVIWLALHAVLFWWLAFGRYGKRSYAEYCEASRLR